MHAVAKDLSTMHLLGDSSLRLKKGSAQDETTREDSTVQDGKLARLRSWTFASFLVQAFDSPSFTYTGSGRSPTCIISSSLSLSIP